MLRNREILKAALELIGIGLVVMIVTALICTLIFPSSKSPPPEKLSCTFHLVNPGAQERDKIWTQLCGGGGGEE